MKLLLFNLSDAGFKIKIKDKYGSKIELKDLSYIDKLIEPIFDEFEPFGKDKEF